MNSIFKRGFYLWKVKENSGIFSREKPTKCGIEICSGKNLNNYIWSASSITYFYFSIHLGTVMLKFLKSEYAIKDFVSKVQLFWKGHKILKKKLPHVLTLLSKNSCFVKTDGRLFQIMWPSLNVLNLAKAKSIATKNSLVLFGIQSNSHWVKTLI